MAYINKGKQGDDDKFVYLKNYFGGVFELSIKLEKLKQEICELIYSQESVGASYKDEKVQKSLNRYSMEGLIIKKMNKEEQALKIMLDVINLEHEILQKREYLDNSLQRAVITWRYVCRFTFRSIANKAKLSEMQVIRLHNEAIRMLCKHY